MAKLYFKFGAMGSSKTAQALMTKFNYEEKNKTVWLIKPSTDTRDDSVDSWGHVISMVRSRIGLQAPAQPIAPTDDILALFRAREAGTTDVIICDECQFLTGEQVEMLKHIVDDYDVPVLCFGLRADFQTKLFPGSQRLFEIADSISEIKCVCHCGRKATVNARFDADGRIVTSGAQIELGGNDKYVSMCYKCYYDLTHQDKTDERMI